MIRTKAGELVARSTADLSVLQGLIAEILLGLIEYPLTAFVFLMYLFVMNLKMTLLVFFMVPLIALLIRLFGRKVKKNSTYVQNATADVTSAYHETLLCLKLVHEYFTGKRESERFRDLAENLYKKVMRWNRWHLGLGPLMDTVVFLVMPAILIVGKVYFHHTLGELLAMAYAFSRVYRPIKRLALVNNHIKTLQGATDRVFEIMRTVPEIRDKDGAEVLSRRKGTIEFKNVNFAYAPNEPVLKDVSFTLEAGEMAAFVGSTGAGKSTLLDLIPRFYDVTGGAILIDGHDVRDVTLESLRKRIGIVNQDILLFNETIRYNISYGDPEKSADEVESAARAAYAHDFIMAQPKGYETSIGDMGSLLSGRSTSADRHRQGHSGGARHLDAGRGRIRPGCRERRTRSKGHRRAERDADHSHRGPSAQHHSQSRPYFCPGSRPNRRIRQSVRTDGEKRAL